MMTGRELARRIRSAMTEAGIDPLVSRTWRGNYDAAMVQWYGMALNLSGWGYCDECGNEHPDAELYRPEPGADTCLCRWCYQGSIEDGWYFGVGGIGQVTP